MATIKNTCEGTDTTTLTTGNSGGASGDALANVTGTWQFSSTGKAHGATGWRCVQTTAAAWRAYWSYTASGTLAVRIYTTLNSLPSAARDLLTLVKDGTFSNSVKIGIDGTNHLQVKDAAGSTKWTASAALSAATTYRWELQVNGGTTTTDGTINFQYFLGDSASAIQSYAGTNVNAGGGSISRTQLGANDSATIDITFDDPWTATGSMSAIGPVVTNTKPVADAGTDQTDVEPWTTVTLVGTGSSDPDSDTITYAWTQTDGTTVALSSTTSSQPTFEAPGTLDGDTLTFSLTVNDGTVDSDADTVDVTVLAATDTIVVGGVEVPLRLTVVTS